MSNVLFVVFVMFFLTIGCVSPKQVRCTKESLTDYVFVNNTDVCEISMTESTTINDEMWDECCDDTSCKFVSAKHTIMVDNDKFEECMRK